MRTLIGCFLHVIIENGNNQSEIDMVDLELRHKYANFRGEYPTLVYGELLS